MREGERRRRRRRRRRKEEDILNASSLPANLVAVDVNVLLVGRSNVRIELEVVRRNDIVIGIEDRRSSRRPESYWI
jgi:hypothetical protein